MSVAGNPPDLAAKNGNRVWIVTRKDKSGEGIRVETEHAFDAMKEVGVAFNAHVSELEAVELVEEAPKPPDVVVSVNALTTELLQMRDQLSHTQKRCTEILDERRANDLTLQVRAFHVKFGYPVSDVPTRDVSDDDVRFRARLMTEEFFEMLKALFHDANFDPFKNDLFQLFERATPNVRLVDLADGCADLDYTVQGTRLTFGIPRQEVANEVSRTNLLKEGGPRVNGKLMKPEGWKPPDIAGILRDAALR